MRKDDWKEATLPVSRLRELFQYDPASGDLNWRQRKGSSRSDKWANTRLAGKTSGWMDSRGYRRITLSVGGSSVSYLAHRIIWALVTGAWPESEIDHRNGDRGDNRWVNLRHATPSQNCQNKKKPLGVVKFKGVTFEKKIGTYRARITTQHGRKSLGLFALPEEAARAYDKAAVVEHGPFAVTNKSLGLLEPSHASE